MKNITSMMVGMLAETFIHPGTGQTVGAIDLPVARESATNYPYVAGSSLKGALRSAYERGKGISKKVAGQHKANKDEEKRDDIFGDDKQEAAGNVLVSDARLLLLPVRSLSSSHKWLTCPHLLERLARDRQRCGLNNFAIPTVDRGTAHGHDSKGTKLFLEERSFIISDNTNDEVITLLQDYIPNTHVAQRLNEQLVILHDDDFVWFARYALAVNARNALTKEKTSENLWYEETIPPDTVMYSLLAARHHGANGDVTTLRQQIGDYLQVGGNETVGQGWFKLQWLDGNSSDGNGSENTADTNASDSNEVAHA